MFRVPDKTCSSNVLTGRAETRIAFMPHGGICATALSNALSCRNNSLKLLCHKCSATDQSAINIRTSEQFGCVLLVAAATVKDRGALSHLLAVLLGYQRTDKGVNLLCLLRCSGQTCTDSPNGFVSQRDVGPLLGAQVEYRAFELCLNYLVLLAGFALLFYFADAEDNLQTVGESEFNFVLQDLIILVIICTAPFSNSATVAR